MKNGITISADQLISIMEGIAAPFASGPKTEQDLKEGQAQMNPMFELLAEADIAGGYNELTEAVEYCALELDLSDDDLMHAALAHIRQQSSVERAPA